MSRNLESDVEVTDDLDDLFENEEEGLEDVEDYVPNHNQLYANARAVVSSMLASMPLRPKLGLLEFSENYRLLSTSNASGGGMLFKAHPYQREVLRAITSPHYQRIVMMFAAQTGKSEMLNNAIAYFMYMDPSEILMVLPTEESAEEYVKRRIDPMIRDNHFLSQLVNSKDSRNNVMNKYFLGGSVSFIGSGSPTKLASKPIRILICDEVDRYSDTREGSTLKLAQQRTSTFARQRKIILASTPTIKNNSAIEDEFKTTNQFRFYVPCHICGHKQVLDFENIVYTTPEDAYYECSKCRGAWSDRDRRRAVNKGEWILDEANRNKRAIGFHLNALYSPYLSLANLVEEKLAIKTENDKQVFENTVLCKSYQPVSVSFEPEDFQEEYEDYTPETLPLPIRYVTCGVDVQATRLELEFRGWGKKYESWGVEYIILQGDTSQPYVWEELRKLLL